MFSNYLVIPIVNSVKVEVKIMPLLKSILKEIIVRGRLDVD